MRFLGMTGYYQRFCHLIAEPFTNLLSKKSKFVWSEKCEQAINQLKVILGNTPVLLAPDFNKSLKLALMLVILELGLFFCKKIIIV